MQNEIYCISGGLCPDEDAFYINIYKLLVLGNKNERYIWIRINGVGGIGILLEPDEFFSKDGGAHFNEGDAIIDIIQRNKMEDYFIIKRMTFDEVLKYYSETTNNLTKELEERRTKFSVEAK